MRRVKVDGVDYNTEDLSEKGLELVERLSYLTRSLEELKNSIALLYKAKNAYIEDLKTEIIQERTGVDFSDLFSDE